MLFRTARALVALDRLDDASKALETLRSLGPDPSEGTEAVIVALQTKVEKLRTARDEAVARRKEALEREQQAAAALKQALVVRDRSSWPV